MRHEIFNRSSDNYLLTYLGTYLPIAKFSCAGAPIFLVLDGNHAIALTILDGTNLYGFVKRKRAFTRRMWRKSVFTETHQLLTMHEKLDGGMDVRSFIPCACRRYNL